MPRSRSNSNNSSRSSSTSRSPIRAPPPSPIPPAPTIQNRTTSIANAIVEGLAWGSGVSVAKKIFNYDEPKDDKNTIYIEKKELNVNKDKLWEKYNECIEKASNDSSKCNDMLVEDIN